MVGKSALQLRGINAMIPGRLCNFASLIRDEFDLLFREFSPYHFFHVNTTKGWLTALNFVPTFFGRRPIIEQV